MALTDTFVTPKKATSEWPFYFSVFKLILQKRNLDRGIIEQVFITKKIKIAQFLHYLGVLIIEFLGLLILNWNQQAGNGKCKCIIWSLKIVTFFSDVGAQNEKYQFEFFNFSVYFYPWKGIDMGLYECKDIKTCHNTDGNSQKCFIVRPFEKNVRLHRCRWRMLETKCVGDNFQMLVTIFRCWRRIWPFWSRTSFIS